MNENKHQKSFSRADVLNTIYTKYMYTLPWTSIKLPEDIKKQLEVFPCSEKILLVGCGLGQHLLNLKEMGFDNIWASDFSSVAISEVKVRYPFVNAFVCPTEDLYKKTMEDFLVLDIHNLHQINPLVLKPYLESLKTISRKIFISWIYEPDKGYKVKSDIGELGDIFMHSLEDVENILKMKKIHQFDYDEIGNPEYFKDKEEHPNHFVGGVFV